jgi:predicted SprT family Zn-dependent metalloprotease
MSHIIVRNYLHFEHACVGARISFTPRNSNHPLLYDIATADLNLIQEDFSVTMEQGYSTPSITLIERGSLLVPANGEPNVNELTYGKFAVLLGFNYMENTDVELKKMYNKYNKLVFGDKLPRLTCVYWTNRMTSCAGVCKSKARRVGGIKEYFQFTIGMSIPYHNEFKEEIVDTLVHEMIHVKLPSEHHGSWFHQEMYRIKREHGIHVSLKAQTTEARKERTPNYIYACLKCGQEYKRFKALDLHRKCCGHSSCRGKLHLKEDLRDSTYEDVDWGAGKDW